MEIYFAFGRNTNPYINLATEWDKVQNNAKNSICLFLWQNQNTVVIGANQNPYRELNLDAIKENGTSIARRRTGGGAVYHDLGNLNFSFIADKSLYDAKKQLSVVQMALKTFGLKAEISGRNDITLNGRKFSGNAYYKDKNNCLHHGTLLINTDFNTMKNYLSPRESKLKKYGVSSVKSRVINLADIAKNVTPKDIAFSLKTAFEQVYGQKSKELDINTNDNIIALAEAWQNDNYIFGKWKDFDAKIEQSFEWGTVEIDLNLANDTIEEIFISSDSLYPKSIEKAKELLTGKKSNDINFLATNDTVMMDIINLVRSKICLN
ncbi:MAG: lipoate--protein ligase [Clostridiales bacterium]|nr:lipoate--protein ligase [Clostridiales bacterium]